MGANWVGITHHDLARTAYILKTTIALPLRVIVLF